MIENKKRIRRDYEPLNVVTSMKLLTPNSPTNQVYNAALGEYEADREISPTVIYPLALASCKDGSWQYPIVNSLLVNMIWMANKVDISTLPEWSGKYTIEQEGERRGTIVISRNVPTSQKLELSFSAIFADNRTGNNIPVHADGIALTTSDKSEDSYSLSIGCEENIKYNPFLDKLLMYEYKVANNIIIGSDSLRNSCIDNNAYLRTIPVTVYKGGKVVTSGYAISLNKLVDNTLVPVSVADGIVSFVDGKVVLDMRIAHKADYVIVVTENGKEATRKQFSLDRERYDFSLEPVSMSSINPNETVLINKAIVHYNGSLVEYPEVILDILWKTNTYSMSKDWNYGQYTRINVCDTGIGNTYADSYIDLTVAAEQKDAFTYATDISGMEYTDTTGDNYIIN